MYRQRTFLAGLIVSLSLAMAPTIATAASVEAAANEFVSTMAGDAVHALTAPGASRAERIHRFRRLFNDHFAIKAIGKWVLGRHWRTASAEERREYLMLFEDLIVVSYVDHFARYSSDALHITQSRADGDNGAMVTTEFKRPNDGRPIRVDWRIASKGKTLKVVDVIVAGTSMSVTLRSDFASIVRRHDGRLDGLIDILRTKTASLQEAATR